LQRKFARQIVRPYEADLRECATSTLVRSGAGDGAGTDPRRSVCWVWWLRLSIIFIIAGVVGRSKSRHTGTLCGEILAPAALSQVIRYVEMETRRRETFIALRARRQAVQIATAIANPSLNLTQLYCRECGTPLRSDRLTRAQRDCVPRLRHDHESAVGSGRADPKRADDRRA
jgi:hypothetical protein